MTATPAHKPLPKLKGNYGWKTTLIITLEGGGGIDVECSYWSLEEGCLRYKLLDGESMVIPMHRITQIQHGDSEWYDDKEEDK